MSSSYFFDSGNNISDLKKGWFWTEREVIDMVRNSKQTSKTVATKASIVLRDGRYSKTSKSVAGSALAQTKKSGR